MPSRSSSFTNAVARVAWPALFMGFAAALQLSLAEPWDGDTAYHVAVGQLTRQHGLLHSFPWTRFSYMADGYVDPTLLFHLLFVPFASLDWIAAARIVGTICTAALLVAIWAVLRAERVHWAGPWVLATLMSSSYFVFRIALVRPHVLGIALALLTTWAAARGRRWLLAACAAAYPFVYTAWFLPLVIVGVVEITRWISGRPPEWRAGAAALAGLAAGLLVHPNFPAILGVPGSIAIVIGNAASSAGASRSYGAELLPLPFDQFVVDAALPLVLALAGGAIAFLRRREDVVPLAFAALAIAWTAAAFRTQRFVEYSVPFSVVTLALAWRWVPRPRLAGAAVAASLTALAAYTTPELVTVLSQRHSLFPRSTFAALRAAVPEDANVFTCEWDTTGRLMIALPGRRFMVALDPMAFHLADPGRARLWESMTVAPPPNPSWVIREVFQSDYALCTTMGDPALIQALASDRDARVLLGSPLWVLFRIGAPELSEAPR